MKLNDFLIIINEKRCEVAGLLEFDMEIPFAGYQTVLPSVDDLTRVEVDEENKIIRLR